MLTDKAALVNIDPIIAQVRSHCESAQYSVDPVTVDLRFSKIREVKNEHSHIRAQRVPLALSGFRVLLAPHCPIARKNFSKAKSRGVDAVCPYTGATRDLFRE
jgi:hypothetical protein